MARTVAVNLAIRGVKTVVSGFDEVSAKSKSTASQLAKHSESASKLGSSMLGMGTIAAGGMGLMVKAAMDWQTEWTGVAKTVNGTNAELDGLQSQLRQMAKEIPASAKEIAAVAENAGQLGIATKDVASFTRVMIDLGNTTNLTSDEVSSSLAQLMNIMGTAGKDVDRLGATVVALGNNGASTEKDIVSMALRIAGAGKAVGMSEAQVLSYASALSSVGIDAEAGGTAISQVLLKMDAAVRGGGQGLQILADTSGVSADAFVQAWGTDAAAATNVFVKGLAKVQAQGGSVTDVLTDLGIDAIRQSDAIRRLASSGDLLTQSLTQGESAWKANSALVIEATKRYSTAESQIQVSMNRINDTAITVGGKILPIVAGIAEGAGKLADGFGKVPGPVLSVLAALGTGVAVIGLAGGGVLKLASAGSDAVKAYRDLSATFPKASAGAATFAKGATAAAIGVVALSAAYAGLKAAGIENMYGGLDDAAGAMANLASQTSDTGQSMQYLSNNTALAAAGIDKFFQDAKGSWGSKDLVGGVNDIGSAFERVNQKDGFRNFYDGFQGVVFGLVGAKSEAALVTDQFGKLDKGLSAMASGGATDQATAAFKQIAAAAKDVSPERLIQLFPEYAAQVRAAGTAVGYTYQSSADLAGAMQGTLPAGMKVAMAAADKTTKSIKTQEQSLNDLTEAMFASSSAALKTSGSQIGFEAAIDDATKAAKENGKNLDINSEKGRANRTALNEQAIAAQAYVKQLTDAHAETSQIVDVTQRARDTFIANAISMGMTEDAAAALATQYGLVPKDVKSTVSESGAAEARGSVEDLLTSLDKLKPPVATYIKTILQSEGVTAAYAFKKDLETHPIIVPIQIVVPKNVKIGMGAVAITAADGGLFKAYAGGGIENHVAQIAPAGAYRIWAEPETKGEAYIPLAQEKWPRSREIWWETGKHLGMVAHADGAVYSGGKPTSPSVNVGSPNIDVYVRATPDGAYVRGIAEDVVTHQANEYRWRG